MMILRQGDVGIVRVDFIPAHATPVARDNGRIILAYGEVTGHAHAILDQAAELVRTDTNERFFRVMENAGFKDAWKVQFKEGIGYVPAIERPEEYVGYVATLGRENVRGVVLEHEEHKPFIVLPGAHRIPGQREYVAPEIVRSVAD